MDDGLVGRTFMSQTPFFYSDITKITIRSYPLAHYIGNCRSTDCFTICLQNYITGNKDYVMKFLLPHEKWMILSQKLVDFSIRNFGANI